MLTALCSLSDVFESHWCCNNTYIRLKTGRAAECVLPPSLESKVFISIRNPDVFKDTSAWLKLAYTSSSCQISCCLFSQQPAFTDLFMCSCVWRNVVIKVWFCVSTYREAMYTFQHHSSYFFALPPTIWTDPETHAAFESWDMRGF